VIDQGGLILVRRGDYGGCSESRPADGGEGHEDESHGAPGDLDHLAAVDEGDQDQS
jgi:hypothetical protein